jgi:hypothetical protein
MNRHIRILVVDGGIDGQPTDADILAAYNITQDDTVLPGRKRWLGGDAHGHGETFYASHLSDLLMALGFEIEGEHFKEGG